MIPDKFLLTAAPTSNTHPLGNKLQKLEDALQMLTSAKYAKL